MRLLHGLLRWGRVDSRATESMGCAEEEEEEEMCGVREEGLRLRQKSRMGVEEGVRGGERARRC